MKKLSTILLFLLALAADLGAADRYASTTGSGTACSIGSPCTLTTAISGAVANDTIILRAGTYTAPTTHPPSGTGSSYTTFRNYCPSETTGETVNITGKWPPFYSTANSRIKIHGCLNGTSQVFTITGGDNPITVANGSSYIWIENLVITGGTGQGIFLGRDATGTSGYNTVINSLIHTNGTDAQLDHGIYVESHHNTISRNKIYNNACYGIHQYNGYAEESDFNVYSYNEVYGNRRVGGSSTCFQAIISRGNNNRFFNNVLRDGAANQAGGLDISRNSGAGNRFYNNTIFGNGGEAGIAIAASSTSSTVRNNLLSNNTTNFQILGTGAHEKFKNFCTTSGGTTNCDLSGATASIDSSGTLQAGSVLIDAGVAAIYGTITALYNGSAPDIGAFEAFAYTNSEIGLVAATKIVINFQSAYAPVLPASSCTGWSATIDGTPDTLTSCPTTGNAQITLNLTTTATAGQTVAWSYNPTTGAFRDSSLIGSTLSQELFATGPITATNNIAVGTGEVWTARHFRCRDWAKAPSTNTAQDWLAGEDVNCTVRNDGGRIAIATVIDCTGANCPNAGWEYYFNYDGGAYAAVSASCAVNQLCYDNTQPAAMHGAQITAARLTTPQSTFIPGGIVAQASSFPNVDLSQNSSTELQGMFATQVGLAAGKVICVRPRRDGGTAINYDATGTACFTMVAPGASAL